MFIRGCRMKKTEFYQREDVVHNYMDFRYAGKSGGYVNSRELNTVKSLLPDKGRILDVPSGVGRLTFVLDDNYHITGVDYSKEMLNVSRHLYHESIQADATNLPFTDKSFDAVVTLRFFIHYDNIRPFLREFKRVLKDNGVIVFERYKWTPLIFNIFQNILGGKTFIHRKKKLLHILKEEGFELIEQKSCFLFSPFVYTRLPFLVVKVFDYIEKILPESIRIDDYWKVRKKCGIKKFTT